MPPILTYSSNRPLDLQEKVITTIKNNINSSTKNLREQASSFLPYNGESVSRNIPIKQSHTEKLLPVFKRDERTRNSTYQTQPIDESWKDQEVTNFTNILDNNDLSKKKLAINSFLQ